MVKVGLSPFDFYITNQLNRNTNQLNDLNITLGSSNAPANITVYGDLINNGQNFFMSNIPINQYSTKANVGIGTSIPTHSMHIYSTNTQNNNYEETGIFMENTTEGPVGLFMRNKVTNDLNNTWYIGMTSNSTSFNISLADSSPNQNISVNDSNTMFVFQPDGNIGIGTARPSTTLEVNGSIMLNTGYNILGYRADYNAFNSIAATPASSITLGQTGGGAFCWIKTNNVGRMMFGGYVGATNGNGAIVIGGPENIESGSSTLLIGNGLTVYAKTFIEANVGIGVTTPLQSLHISSNSCFIGNVGIGTTNPLYALHLTSDSAFKPSTSTWTISSDKRLKTNIIDADLMRCWEILKILPLKKYKWNPEIYKFTEVIDSNKLGWLAQDVETIFPKSVEISAMYHLSDCKLLNTDQIYATMYGALQQLIYKIENLENTIAKILLKLSTSANLSN